MKKLIKILASVLVFVMLLSAGSVCSADFGSSELISLSSSAAVTEDGSTYYMVIDPDSLPYVKNVRGKLFAVVDDQLLSLGSTADVYADFDSGLVLDLFSGTWVALPNGEFIPVHLVATDGEISVYCSPIALNGKRTNLRIIRDHVNDYLYIDCACKDFYTDGEACTGITVLKAGDIITPYYTFISIDSGEQTELRGHDYEYDGDINLIIQSLFDGVFYYSFSITDVDGNNYDTTSATLVCADGQYVFVE